MNETLRNADGRWVLHMERRLAQPPDKVWRALTQPVHLGQWFPSEVEIDDLRVGGKLRFVYPGEDFTEDGEIVELDAPRLIAFTWDDNVLRWEVRPEGDGCVLVLDHTFDDRYGAASFATGWETCLDALEAVVAGRPVDVGDGKRPERHDAFVESLGLAEGEVQETPEGWQVRFERQMIGPAEEVWAALTAGAPAPTEGGPAPGPATVAEVSAGPVTAVDAPTLLEYEWRDGGAPGGRVRWELTTGTGHGARLVLTQTGPSGQPEAQSTALAAWRATIDGLAAGLREAAAGPAS